MLWLRCVQRQRKRHHVMRGQAFQGMVFGTKALVQRCTLHYAEQRIMPSRAQNALWDNGFALIKSA